jgi:lipoyl(octanoyl) transferase
MDGMTGLAAPGDGAKQPATAPGNGAKQRPTARGKLPELWVCHLGTLEYGQGVALQERLRAARQRGDVPDLLLTLQHWPVYTRGRRSMPGELPMGEDWYRAQGIEIVDTNRGGKITYHGPGQLVGYPIVGVSDVVEYVRTLERALVAALAEEGVVSRPRFDDGPDFTGVWVAERKIASIGVHVQRGVTTHGFAVNVENDLQPFSWIVPCGLEGVQMTSLIRETGRLAGHVPCFRKRAAWQLAQALGLRQRLVSLERLERAAGGGRETVAAGERGAAGGGARGQARAPQPQ